MAKPDDADKVAARLRLGWALAELQGRYRPNPPEFKTEPLPPNAGIALALRPEHSDAQLREQVLDVFCKVLEDSAVLDSDPKSTDAFSKAVAEKAHTLDGPDRTLAQWNDFTSLVERLDTHVQNTLAASSDSELSGYLLGRGLAETFWALQPSSATANATESPANATETSATPAADTSAIAETTDAPAPTDQNWCFLLGAERVAELQRLLGRLSTYFGPYTAPSISGSLCVWQEVANREDWRNQPDAEQDLYDQTRRWYELLVIGQDPTTLIKPFAFLRNLRGAVNAARAFLPQLVFGLISIVALVGIVKGASTSWGKAAGAAVGAFGLSLTSLTAKAKSSAQAMTTRLQQDSYSDLVAIEITVVPPRRPRDQELPRDQHWRRFWRDFRKRLESPTRRAVDSAIRGRPLTTAVSVTGAPS
jgi:hypothetical protein